MTLDYNPHDAFHQGHPQLIQAIDETLLSEDAIPYFEQAVAHYKEVVSSHLQACFRFTVLSWGCAAIPMVGIKCSSP